jgi:16S rRNA (adenine1518-N6/adenine1519-N6)-dimethyltransferase
VSKRGPRAKKSYGQHFLSDEGMAQRIVEFATEYKKKLPLLEVGPGKGVLTKYLLDTQHEFKAVEADWEMTHFLQQEYEGMAEHLIQADFLKLSFNQLFPGREFILFGNFPYNISSQILIKMVQNRERIPYMVGMFQKEVAERVIAPAGSKTYGRISVMIQAYYQGKVLLKLGPGSFSPPPKVDSAVICLERKEALEIDCDEKLFKQVVSLGFSQRRKMLRNTLKSLVNDNDFLKQDVFTKRPEQLPVEEFIELTKLISKYKENES